jgi:iron(III) transport system substrate-binding protein
MKTGTSVWKLALLALAVSASPAVASDISLYNGPDRSQKILEGARKEGKVVLYSAMIVNQALRPLMDAFNKKYPGVTGEYARHDARELINKVLAESRARALVADVVESGGIATPLVKAGVLEKWSSPVTAALPKDMVDKDQYWAANRLNYFGLGFNTKLVSKADAPKSYTDLLDPKWKGKLSWSWESETGGTMLFVTAVRRIMGEQKAEEYFAKLANQNVLNVVGSSRALVDRVIQGEYPMAIGIFAHHPLISAKAGAPVDTSMFDPVPSNSSDLALMKNAPHPHAAMLLIDFILSNEGQATLREAEYFPANPAVDPLETLRPVVPEKLGMKQVFLDTASFFDDRAKSIELQNKYFDKQ